MSSISLNQSLTWGSSCAQHAVLCQTHHCSLAGEFFPEAAQIAYKMWEISSMTKVKVCPPQSSLRDNYSCHCMVCLGCDTHILHWSCMPWESSNCNNALLLCFTFKVKCQKDSTFGLTRTKGLFRPPVSLLAASWSPTSNQDVPFGKKCFTAVAECSIYSPNSMQPGCYLTWNVYVWLPL